MCFSSLFSLVVCLFRLRGILREQRVLRLLENKRGSHNSDHQLPPRSHSEMCSLTFCILSVLSYEKLSTKYHTSSYLVSLLESALALLFPLSLQEGTALVAGVELFQVNTCCAHVRYPDGRETTIDNKYFTCYSLFTTPEAAYNRAFHGEANIET